MVAFGKCIETSWPLDKDGYGLRQFTSGDVRAHRQAWESAYGPISNGLFVLHRCDNRKCVRPSHLFLGTTSDNIRDMWAKGRGRMPPHVGRKGSTHPLAQLDEDSVLRMRAARAEGATFAALGRDYGVHRQTARDAVMGRRWKHI